MTSEYICTEIRDSGREKNAYFVNLWCGWKGREVGFGGGGIQKSMVYVERMHAPTAHFLEIMFFACRRCLGEKDRSLVVGCGRVLSYPVFFLLSLVSDEVTRCSVMI